MAFARAGDVDGTSTERHAGNCGAQDAAQQRSATPLCRSASRHRQLVFDAMQHQLPVGFGESFKADALSGDCIRTIASESSEIGHRPVAMPSASLTLQR